MKAIALQSPSRPASKVQAEGPSEVKGTRAGSAKTHSTALLSQMSVDRSITDPCRLMAEQLNQTCEVGVKEGSSGTFPLECVAQGDLNRDPEESSSPGESGAE